MKQIPEEIKAGMALLDKKVPGWREKANPNSLDMAYCFSCILGQVFGEYLYGLKKLGITEEAEWEQEDSLVFERAQSLGFQSKVLIGITYDYRYLTQAWKEALSETSSPIAAD
jgi:hypothetical protein